MEVKGGELAEGLRGRLARAVALPRRRQELDDAHGEPEDLSELGRLCSLVDDWDDPCGIGASAVAWAARMGRAAALSMLLAAGGLPDSSDGPAQEGSRRAIDLACMNGDARCLSILLDAGADPEGDPGEGLRPSMLAAGHGRSRECLGLLAQAGADLGARCSKGRSVAWSARSVGDVELAEWIEAAARSQAERRAIQSLDSNLGGANPARGPSRI